MEVVASSTSSPSVLPLIVNCQVCSQRGHGFHFGAFTCRACAAFFRRCHFSSKLETRCNRLSGTCQPKSGRWFCRKCRLDRCLELGMIPDNIQYYRDPFSSSTTPTTFQLPMTVERALGVPHLGVFLQNKNKAIPCVEVSYIVKKAMRELLKPKIFEKHANKLSDLEQLAIGLEEYQSLQREHLSVMPMLSRYEQMKDWDRNMSAAAKWMTKSDRIRKLDERIKLTLLQSMWIVWGRLERIAMTAKMRVNGGCGKRQFVTAHDILVDYDGMTADISWGSQHSYEDLSYIFSPTEVFYEEIINDIIEIRPDSVELSFLLLEICLQIAGWQNEGQLDKETDGLRNAMADDLHQYYINKKNRMYAVRLKQIMKIKEHFLVLWRRRREKYVVGIALQLFRAQYTVSGYFQTPC